MSMVELLVVIAIGSAFMGLLLGGVQKVRMSAAKAGCQNNIRQIALATHSFQSERVIFPAGISLRMYDQSMPYAGWTTQLLPHLGHESVWQLSVRAYAEDRWFLSAPHSTVRKTNISVFRCDQDTRLMSGDARVAAIGFTSYLGVQGIDQITRDGVFFVDSTVRLTDIVDGTSGTLLLGERPPSTDLAFGWWYAGWGQDKDGSAEMLLGVRERAIHESLNTCDIRDSLYKQGSVAKQCDTLHFWSLHPGGANFAFCDGSVRFLRYEADLIMPALATRAGGEVVAIPD